MVPALLSILHIFVTLATAQLEIPLFDPDYDYQNAPLDENDDVLLKDYIPIQTPQEQRFLEGLIIEAGRHVLFPELYINKPEEPPRNNKPKFFEIKGQPEIEENYMQRRTRAGRADCPEDCPFYKPVCGTDGKVYESECHLLQENCGINNVSIGPWAKCRGKHYLCPSLCLDINDPVCASDGRIYHNSCVMRKRNCGKLVDVLPLRKCFESARQSKAIDRCPEDCQEIYKPVCGSNGVIYYNECFMKMRTCRQGIAEVDMESCVHVPKCPEACLPLYDPVCGSDARLYINQCRMLQQNCGKEVKRMPQSFCRQSGKGSSPPLRT